LALSINKLKEFREKKEWTQEKLADKSEVTRQTIISIEKGKYVPSLELALKFAELFNCKVEDLFKIRG
jgi:putative transcriptional regulator